MPEEYLGVVIEKLGPRRGEMIEMKNPGAGLVRLLYRIPARGLFGYRSEFLTDTRGNGHHAPPVPRLRPVGRPAGGRKRGVLVVDGEGDDRGVRARQPAGAGTLVRVAGRPVYEGMIVGESSRPGDMDVNVDEGEEAHEHADARARTTTSCSSRPGR